MLVVRTEARLHPVLVRQITWAIPTSNANLNVKSIVIVHTTSLVSLKSVGIHALDLAEPMLIAEWLVIIPSVAVLLDTLVILWNPVELHLQSVIIIRFKKKANISLKCFFTFYRTS